VTRAETVAHVLDLLRVRHKKDVIIPECPTGPQEAENYGRLDLLAIRRSWRNACIDGYEIKVARSDWLNDDTAGKWRRYLPYCNRLWLVAPAGVIPTTEVPEGVGLLHLTSTGTRLIRRVQARRREMTPEAEARLLWAIIINRVGASVLSASGQPLTREQRMAEWQRMLEKRRLLAYAVRGRIRELLDEAEERIWAAESRARDAERRVRVIDEYLRSIGIDPEQGAWQIRAQLEDLVEQRDLVQLVTRLEAAKRAIEQVEEIVRPVLRFGEDR
jgi:hypothetical protein